jgi:hypothetical protein
MKKVSTPVWPPELPSCMAESSEPGVGDVEADIGPL